MNDSPRYLAIWRFRVKPEKLSAFVEAYASGGAWSVLFANSPEYIATTLVCDRSEPRVYLTVDEWKSKAAFDRFKLEFAAQYAELDRACNAVTESEELIAEGERLE